MALGELLSLAHEIEAMPLNETDKEKLIVQAADLIRFKEAFPEPVRIIQPFEERGVVIATGDDKVTLLFCEHHCRKDEVLDIREVVMDKGQPLWLVFITFSGKECCDKIADQVASHPFRARCERAFVLDYSTGFLHTL